MVDVERRAEDFLGNARFAVRRKLGAGGMGVVYSVFDRERGVLVALKTLRRFDGSALYRFKQEFRALADVHHPNLVALHELISEGEHWFFTMELVDGYRFTDYVAREFDGALDDTMGGRRVDLDDEDALEDEPPLIAPYLPRGLRHTPADLERLRRATVQLAAGVEALHAAGKLHRDIKPSNVLVTHKGRVVVLDFGLVTELAAQRRAKGREQFVAGTAEYMAPEQAAGLPLSPASDWYGVGVMLYESLTGLRPFRGEVRQVLLDKQRFDPPAPSTLVDGVPPDLDALCMALLARPAERRPGGPDILKALGGARSALPTLPVAGSLDSGESTHLVGRARHLAVLEAAFADVGAGSPATVFVHGRSGMGKTALVRTFLDGLATRGAATILAARCHERESVPYKAVDSLIDLLSRQLLRHSVESMREVLPAHLGALARLFPVLLEVCAMVGVQPEPERQRDAPHELRLRAFGALRQLLSRMARSRPVVLAIDDLHWGDADSAALLAHLVRPPDAPRILLLGVYRSEETAVPALLERLIEDGEPGDYGRARGDRSRLRELSVEPIDDEEARQLALELLADAPSAAAQARQIAKEAGGNPYFVQELVRHALSEAQRPSPTRASDSSTVSLEAVLSARLAALPEPALRILELIAVSGRPVSQGVILRAADLAEHGRLAINVLRTAHLVRTRGPSDGDAIETYHDRIKDAAVGRIEPDSMVERHTALAYALQHSGEGDAETLALHFRGARQPDTAANFAEQAAEKAARALAFGRAAELYQLTIELRSEARRADGSDGVDPDRRRLSECLADALANAGRGAESARAYVATAELEHDAGPRRELRRRAADQLLRSGRVDEGLEVMRSVLADVGLELPNSPQRALRSLLARRAQLRLRGIGFDERSEAAIDAEDLTRIDTCWSVAMGLSTVDNVRGAEFQTRHLLLALQAGEPYRVARALLTEAAYAANAGGPSARRTRTLLAAATELARRVQHPHALGLIDAIEGIVAFEEGRYKDARAHCAAAERIFRERCTNASWEIETSQLFHLMSLSHLGELGELARLVGTLLEEASARGDLYAGTNFRIGYPNLAWLLADNPDGARRATVDALKRWSQQGFNAQHYYGLLAQVHVDLYVGDGTLAFLRVQEAWRTMSRSLLLRVQFLRIEALWLRARAALAASGATTSRERKRYWAQAEGDGKRIARERMRWSTPIAELVRAGVAAQRGQEALAVEALRAAITGFDAADMRLAAAVARRRLSGRVGGDEGAALLAASDRYMREQDVLRPDAFADVFAPGL